MPLNLNDVSLLAASQPSNMVLLRHFNDCSNSASPGAAPSFSVTIPSGTQVVVAMLINATPNKFGDCYLGAATLTTLQWVQGSDISANLACLTSGIPSGTQTFTAASRGLNTGSIHTVLWFLKGVDTTTSNWRYGIDNSADASTTAHSVTVTPTAATGILLGHTGLVKTDATFTAFAAITPTVVDFTEYEGSASASYMTTGYGHVANTTTASKAIGHSTDPTARRGVACGLWIPSI